MRVRITFKKGEAMRFIGHLDLYRTWERIFRRAGLPLAYSQGFKPHPRINLASALPLGFTGSNEILEFWLENDLPLHDIEQRINKALPSGLEIVHIKQISLEESSLQSTVAASEYTITLLESIPELYKRINEILEAKILLCNRRGKQYDLRPLVIELLHSSCENDTHQEIKVILKTEEKATGRPEELVALLGGHPEHARIRRDRIIFKEPTK